MKQYEGPAQESVKSIQYSGVEGPLPVITYSYPSGVKEEFRDYGEYFGTSWSPDPNVGEDVMIAWLSQYEQLNPVNGFSLRVARPKSNELISVEFDSINDVPEAYELLTSELNTSVALEGAEGTFYWEYDRSQKIDSIGLNTYNRAPKESLFAWRSATAHPEIVAHDREFLEMHVPLAEEIQKNGH